MRRNFAEKQQQQEGQQEADDADGGAQADMTMRRSIIEGYKLTGCRIEFHEAGGGADCKKGALSFKRESTRRVRTASKTACGGGEYLHGERKPRKGAECILPCAKPPHEGTIGGGMDQATEK